NIEDDLVQGNSIVLPRIMLRLLIVLSNDRKLNLDTWQTALRRQYNRRDPLANPIGPEPPKTSNNSRYASVVEEDEEEEASKAQAEESEEQDPSHENDLHASTSASLSRPQTPASEALGVKDEEETKRLAQSHSQS
ncbi:hypothetical protein MPER_13656, partial [Moniliophthora perniciosa FA553]